MTDVGDAIIIESGAKPWRPTEDTEILKVYHRFSIPLAGLVRQGGERFFFWCIVGHAAPENVWAYAHADDEGVALMEAATNETFDEALRAVAFDRTCVVALASDENGLSVSAELDPPADFDSAYERGLERLQAKVREAQEELRAVYAHVERVGSVSTSLAPTAVVKGARRSIVRSAPRRVHSSVASEPVPQPS